MGEDETRSGIPSEDGTLPIRRRTPAERRAYVQGYLAALEAMKGRLHTLEAAIQLTENLDSPAVNL